MSHLRLRCSPVLRLLRRPLSREVIVDDALEWALEKSLHFGVTVKDKTWLKSGSWTLLVVSTNRLDSHVAIAGKAEDRVL